MSVTLLERITRQEVQQPVRLLHYSKSQDLKPNPKVLPTVQAQYVLPFQPFNYQIEAVNTFGDLDRVGLYADPGTGKTLMSTLIALYHLHQGRSDSVIVIMPPILLTSWKRLKEDKLTA